MKTDFYLIIGLTKESRHWSHEFIETLQKELAPNSIQCIDLPGAGVLRHDSSPKNLSEIVQQARKQAVFNPEHRRVALAISMGGMVAWEWATQFPDDFTHLVMVNSSLGSLSHFWERARPKAIMQFFRIACAAKGPAKEKLILDISSNHPEKAQKTLKQWVEVSETGTMSLKNVLAQLMAAMTFKPKAIPKIPMLVLTAQQDRLVSYHCSEAIAKFAKTQTQVKFVVVNQPQIGHAFHVDGPHELVAVVKDYLSAILT